MPYENDTTPVGRSRAKVGPGSKDGSAKKIYDDSVQPDERERKAFFPAFDQAWQRAAVSGTTFGYLFLTLVPKGNNEHSPTARLTLHELEHLVSKCLIPLDPVVAKYTDETFGILLPRFSAGRAIETVSCLQDALEGLRIGGGRYPGRPISTTVGVVVSKATFATKGLPFFHLAESSIDIYRLRHQNCIQRILPWVWVGVFN